MSARESIKPAIWGAIGGAIAATVIGFNFGGWVLAGTASEMESASAEAAIVQAFTPLCVAKAELQPETLVALKAESGWKQDDFVVESGKGLRFDTGRRHENRVNPPKLRAMLFPLSKSELSLGSTTRFLP